MQLRPDPTRADLRAFQVARQLHLLPQLRSVFTSNDMSYPLFYSCLDPRAKAAAKHILLCLRSWFCRRLGVRSVDAHPLLSILTSSILSYLSFPEFATASAQPPRSLYVQLGVQALTAADAAAAAAAAEAAAGAPVPTSPAAPPDTGTPATPPESRTRPDSAASPGTPTRQPPSAERLAEVWERSLIYRPIFFIRPHVPVGGLTAASAPESRPNDVFIRMVHTDLLNEESLNTYFGRYGQVSCEPLQRMQLSKCGYVSDEMAYALTEAFRCTPEEVYIQDFIVSTDSPQNAERAVASAYYKELLFIALHESREGESAARRQRPQPGAPLACPADGNNCFAIADVDALIAESATVCQLVPATAAAMSGAAPTTTATTAERRRARRLERRRRRRERRQSRGEGAGVVDGGSDGSDESDTSSSESSSSDESGGALAGYVPDIVVDGLPYWLTEDQLKVLLQGHGSVASLRLSIDDLTGAFTGAVLVRMSTVEEAVQLSDALHGTVFKGFPIRAGVLNESLQIEALVSGEVRWPLPPPGERMAVPPPRVNVTVNDRVWV